jgi:hypothetical protein
VYYVTGKHKRIKQRCLVCEIEFFKRPAKYCSLKCRGVAFKGPYNPVWRGGITLNLPAYTRTRTLAKRQFVAQFKQNPCADCHNRFPPVCMDFDHRDPATKIKGGVSTLVSHNATNARILEEIAKCDLVCSNCHRIRTQSRHLQADDAHLASIGCST